MDELPFAFRKSSIVAFDPKSTAVTLAFLFKVFFIE